MLFRASVRELLRHPLRTGLAVLGVAVSAAMLVDMLMLGGGITTSFRELLLGKGYAIRVTPRGTLPLDTDATLEGADSLRRAMAADPGVAGVAPVLAVRLTAAGTSALALGVDPDEQGVYRLTGGREPASGEAVVGPGLARDGDLAPGDSLVLVAPAALGTAAAGRRTFRVSGTADFVYASREERSVAVSIADLRGLSGRPDRASFLMVRAAPGRDADAVARALSRDFPGVAVASASELVERAGRRLSYFRQLAVILGTVSLFVAALLVGTIMAVSIGERAGIVAALRAVGISRRSLVAALAAESLVLTAAAGVLGLGLGLVVAGRLESILAGFPGLPSAVRFFVLRPGPLLVGYGALLLAGTLAAVVPAWRAASGSIALALHREEP
ncbi:MAG TPA: ABC transporter permease [Gemmatimonadota bacterium]|nr:ABC transporter permease [Gemmatimonadota bacterium]